MTKSGNGTGAVFLEHCGLDRGLREQREDPPRLGMVRIAGSLSAHNKGLADTAMYSI